MVQGLLAGLAVALFLALFVSGNLVGWCVLALLQGPLICHALFWVAPRELAANRKRRLAALEAAVEKEFQEGEKALAALKPPPPPPPPQLLPRYQCLSPQEFWADLEKSLRQLRE